MKTVKKWLIGGLAVAAAATMALGVAACSDGGNDDDEDRKNPPEEAAEIVWQFTGHYTDETLTGFGFDYYIMLNLFDDGTVAGSGYNQLSMDSSDYAENSGFSEKWWTGSWEETKNSEGLDCINLSVRYDEDAENIMGGGFAESRFEYELYPTAENTITFTLDCPIFSGREQQVTGSKTVKYKDFNSFIQGNLYVFEEPEYVVMFDAAADSMPGRIYVQEDGIALFYVGNVDPATNQAKYVISQTWSYTYNDGKLTFKTSETSSVDATIEGTKATVEYERNATVNKIPYTLECADISDLEETEAPAPDEEVKVLVTFTSKDGDTLTVYSDGTAQVSAFGGQLKPKFNWTYSGGVLKFVDAEKPEKTYTAVIDGKSATLEYKETFATVNFSCEDISAITDVAETPEVLVTFTSKDGSTLTVLDDGTANASVFDGALTVKFNWSYQNGVLKFVDAKETTKVYTATINGTKATVEYKENFFPDAVLFTCEDISALMK